MYVAIDQTWHDGLAADINAARIGDVERLRRDVYNAVAVNEYVMLSEQLTMGRIKDVAALQENFCHDASGLLQILWLTHETRANEANGSGNHDVEGRRHGVTGSGDKPGDEEGGKATKNGHGQIVGKRQAGRQHLGREQFGEGRQNRAGVDRKSTRLNSSH